MKFVSGLVIFFLIQMILPGSLAAGPGPSNVDINQEIIFSGTDIPGPEESLGSITGNPNPRALRDNQAIAQGPWYFAGIECNYQFSGVYASLLTRRSNLPTFDGQDRIGGWVGLTSIDGATFVQVGWIYLKQGPGKYNGIFAFYQVGMNNAHLMDSLASDTYYQFRVRYENPNYWRCEMYTSAGWKTLGSAYYPGVSLLYPQAYGESFSDNGYHPGMFPNSTSWGGQVLAGSQWQYWTYSSIQSYVPGIMNLTVLNYYYNIRYWGS